MVGWLGLSVVADRLRGVDILASRETGDRCPRAGKSTYRDISVQHCMYKLSNDVEDTSEE